MGSSPRVRGKPSARAAVMVPRGLIPACAGETSREPYPRRGSPAHPRVCGENSVFSVVTLWSLGSSPRVRGKRYDRRIPCMGDRLIPACAGKTLTTVLKASIPRAHPRVCGENSLSRFSKRYFPGSSPRMRGKRRYAPIVSVRGRLIPAYAGKTLRGDGLTFSQWAHPRVCGENKGTSASAYLNEGSSPRMRGKLRGPRSLCWPVGLIPAYAGKTQTADPSS